MVIWQLLTFNHDPSDDTTTFYATKKAAMDGARIAAGGCLPSRDDGFSYQIQPIRIGVGREGIARALNAHVGALS